MKYYSEVILKNNENCVIRSCDENDAEKLIEVNLKTREETDFLLSYPEEFVLTVEDEREFLKSFCESDNSVRICAETGGKLVGSAGIERVGNRIKNSHRAYFGIGVIKEYWGIGIGKALTLACIECAKSAGYKQLELDVISDNTSAYNLYKSVGFVEYGKNPKGFCTKDGKYQELILMRLDLEC